MMHFATRLRFGLARWALKAGGLSIVPAWVDASVLKPTFHLLTREAYQRNAVVFACISALAFDYPEPPIRIYPDDEPDSRPIKKHPLRKLLSRPNKLMGERELNMYTIAYAALGGNAYWHKVRNRAGQVVELYPYHYGQIQPVPNSDPNGSWVRHYNFDDGTGNLTPIPVDDIVHFKWPSPDPTQPWQAQPPLMAAANEVDSDNETTRYLRALLKNDAVPRTIVSQNKERFMTPEEVQRAKAQWKAMYGGEERGGVIVLEAGASVTRLGLNLEEMAFEALHRVPEKRIAASFRVPLSVAGIGDDPTYSNSEEAYNRYVRSTLSPLWALFGDEVQNSLGDDFGVVTRHDTSNVAALREDQNAVWTRANGAFQAGRLTMNQANQLCGLPPVPGGDIYLWSASIYPVPAMQIGAMADAEADAALNPPPLPAPAQLPAPQDEPIEGEVVDTPKAGTAAAQRTARALLRVRRRIAGRMETAVNRAFDELADRVVLRAREASKADIPITEVKALTVADLLLKTDETAFRDMFRSWAVTICESSWEHWNTGLDMELAFDQSDPAVVAAVKQSGTRVKDIMDFTRDALREVLRVGAEEGWSISQLVNGVGENAGLKDVVTETYRGRARTIARTEIAEAQAAGTIGRYEAASVDKVTILDGGSDDSDDICNQLNGTVQTLEWYRKNTLQHPNCVRCASPYFD